MNNDPQLVLIVEDEPDAGRLLSYHLRRKGYETMVAEDGLTGLNMALEWKPDLLILDLMLPQMNGFEVCRLIKAGPLRQRTAILMLTAMAGKESKLQGFHCGADDFLTKPFDIDELLARTKAL